MKKLCVRAIVPVSIAVTGFVIVCCILLYSHIRNDMTRVSIEHAAHLADTIVKSTRYAMLSDDREMLHNMVLNIGQQQEVEHVRIFNKRGLIMFSKDPGELKQLVDKKSAGCVECHAGKVPASFLAAMEQAREFTADSGERMLAITAPIYNDPSCSTQSCHLPSTEQKVLGTLDIGLSEARLQGTLGLLRMRMTLFSSMVLVLTIGGVAALLRRSVFLTLCDMADFTDRSVHDMSHVNMPTSSRELLRIADNVNQLVAQRNRAVKALKDHGLDDTAIQSEAPEKT
ncbi:MAG: HAMP domain-containing protein [Desulfuromonas sp.]|nr:MAG: HAMP domain-containing protein [Desulfuromonas sp.]